MSTRTLLVFLWALAAFGGTLLFADETAAAPDTKFTNESEAGVVLSTGNSNIRAFNFKQNNAYAWSANT